MGKTLMMVHREWFRNSKRYRANGLPQRMPIACKASRVYIKSPVRRVSNLADRKEEPVKTYLGIIAVSIGFAVTVGLPAAPRQEETPRAGALPPAWAYPVNPGGGQRAADDGVPRRVPGSAITFSLTETRDLFNPPDWHPDGHPAMPQIVSNGRSPAVRACGYCHLPNGQGRPENSGIAGLPAAYIVQQMADYKAGLRRSSEPRMGPPRAMLAIGENAEDDEVAAAAEYFSSFPFKPWIRVVETDTVPETFIAGAMYAAEEGGGREAIGNRIVEIPEDLGRTELRDDASGFVAYLPVGSLGRGEALVTTGGEGRTTRCGVCHGPDLKGLGPVPGLAGRSPSYSARQLYDFQTGARRGAWSALMEDVVDDLTLEDLVAIAAYTASLEP